MEAISNFVNDINGLVWGPPMLVMILGVGLFQFTRAKEVCHGVCHSPMMYFMGHWRPGVAGGFRIC